jgi:Rieske Fe-S protein
MLTRRGFLWVGTLGLCAAAFTSLRSLGNRLVALQPRPHVVTVPGDFVGDVAFVEDVLVCRTRQGIRAFSARCTHLGCTITVQADGLLTCPCHGSQFRSDGTVARGPAARSLEALPHTVDSKTGAISIVAS